MEIFELFNKHKDIEDLIKITAIENAINGIAFADLNAKLFYVNNAFINFFGYESKDQVIGESALNFWVNPEDAKKVIEVISINNCWSGTLIGRKKNGESFDILLNANLLKDNNGKPICMQAVFIDISSQKKIEKELLEKNAFLSNIIDNIPLMIFIKEAKNLKFVKCNKSGEKLLNYKEADLLGKNDYDFFPKEQADFFTGIDKEVLTKKKHFIIEEEPINTPNGVKFLHTQKIPLYNDKGEPIYLLGISEDITARKKAEEKIKEQENFLIKLMEGIPIPIFYKDIEGRYQLFNKAFEDFFGKKKEELIGKNVFDINPPELAKIYHAKDVELFEKPGTQIYESKVKDAQGQIHDVIFHKATILNSDGQPSGLIGAIMDITEKNKMTQELNAAYQ
ncbi:MAG TPA: PAS domain S-box protein, partial [bacterium]|nr:PAS domain S-box protein [bacterium]